MTLTVLNVAYPFARVCPDTAGGAEQVLAALDAALCAAGHHSLVLACEGSRVAGTLLPVPEVRGKLDELAMAAAHLRHRRAIAAALHRFPVDVVHMHGVDFDSYLPPPGPALLVTLHLPVAWYSPSALRPSRPRSFLHCVSPSQHASAGRSDFLPPIENGVDVEAIAGRIFRRRRFALMLTRICPEKGVHLAIEAARRAGLPLLIAGEVHPYAAHRRYFEKEVRPRLNSQCRYLGRIGPYGRRRLLNAARCLLVPSLAEETSSLVAREAAAAGTPVIAFPRGALPETIQHGRTGFLVEGVAEMTAAIGQVERIDAQDCRDHARRCFGLRQMTGRYLDLYARLAEAGSDPGLLRAAS